MTRAQYSNRPNFSKMGKFAAELLRFNHSRYSAVRHLRFDQIRILIISAASVTPCTDFFGDITVRVRSVPRTRNFRAALADGSFLLPFQVSITTPPPRINTAPTCQISAKSAVHDCVFDKFKDQCRTLYFIVIFA